MRWLTYVEATDKFELILIFENKEYRILNIKEFPWNNESLLTELIRDDVQMFQTVEIDQVTGNVKWSNGVELDPDLLYVASRQIRML
jgi:hypothetical protein